MCSRSKLLTAALLWMVGTISLWAQSYLNKLNVDVELQENGDAIITETRRMDIDTDGSELYIVIGNLNGSKVTDFSVSDENGKEYVNVGDWNSSLSRTEKTEKCGIIRKSDGYELCWGLGMEGERIYTAQYRVTDLVRAYNDYDGFNYMFVTRNMNPSPKQATVTIKAPNGELFEEEQVRMWSFGYEGEINLEAGEVVARTNTSLDTDNSMIVMLQLEKGVVNPQIKVDAPFETLKDKAFEGSDYGTEDKSFIQTLKDEPSMLIPIAILFLPILLILYSYNRIRKLKKDAKKDLLWYRDLPYDGNLQKANAVLNACKYGKNNYRNVVSASVLRLIRIGALGVEEHYIEPTGLSKMLGRQGETKKCIVIHPLVQNDQATNTRMLKMLYELFVDAAGSDGILQPKEFKHFIKRNTDRLIDFMKEVKYKMSVKDCRKDMERVRQVFGLKKYLEDFTLANERSMSEVSLWGEYLVYAELFGCADKIREEMFKLNPEFLKMDKMYEALFNNDVVPETLLIAAYGARSAERAISRQEMRSSGFGGSSSIGGGGGFSGGGSGGGIR